jgi:PilZ domain
VRRKLGDRRIRPRYDIVGDLWGTLETVLRLPLRNVSPGGALIESHVPLPAESVHRLTFRCDGQDAAAQVRVRHVKPTISIDGERTYLIGVEFLSVHPALVTQVSRWISADEGEIAAEA